MRPEPLVRSVALLLMGNAWSGALAKEPQELIWDNRIPYKQDKVESALKDPSKDLDMLINEDPYTYLDFTQPVKELDGRYVKLPGFIVPLESDNPGSLKEFLLVPYYGACIHTPPPPPNQIVYVTFDKAVDIESLYDPYWIVGTISTKPYMSGIADAVYRLSGERLEEYKY